MATARTTTSTAPAVPRLEQPFPSVQPPVMNGVHGVTSATREQPQVATPELPPAASAPAVHQPKPQAVNLVLAARAARRRAAGPGPLPLPMTCPVPAAAKQQPIGRLSARQASHKALPTAPRALQPRLALHLPLVAIPA